jgi:molybdate transport system substrate-binding protein
MTMVRSAFLALATILTSLVGAASARAGDVNIAVAANFTVPAQEIAKAFEAATGDHAVLSFGASGQFYAQITHGAPFEVFLSADADRPAKAEADGLAVPGTRFTYAVGRLVLWSPTPGLVDDRGRVLATGDFKHIAIADPGAAPYGAAAVQTLKTLGLYDRLAPRLVTGASITQALQFVQTGNAELGFVALSQVVDTTGGSRWLVPEADHAPIIQQAVLLKTGAGDKAARAFMAFLKSPRAVSIIRRYGYDLP